MTRSNDFTFTVAITPNVMSIEKDLNYIKSAMLYADRVQLINPLAYLIIKCTDPRFGKNEKTALRLLEFILPFIKRVDIQTYNSAFSLISELKRILYSPKYKQLPFNEKIGLKEMFRKFIPSISDTLISSIGVTEYHELEQMLNLKRVTLIEFEHTLADPENCVFEFFRLLNKHISSTYPIYDEVACDLMKSASHEGIIELSVHDRKRITHAGASDNIIQYLPSFEVASFDEIQDIRKELNDPLVRFRSAMLGYTEEISTLPWEPGFKEECALLYHEKIAPAVLEINELSKENSFWKNLAINVGTDRDFLKTAGGILVSVATSGLIEVYPMSSTKFA